MRKQISTIIVTAIVSILIGWFFKNFLVSPKAQADELSSQGAAIGTLNGQVNSLSSQQETDEKDSSQFQEEISAQLAALKTEIDATNQNVFNMATAYGIPNPKK